VIGVTIDNDVLARAVAAVGEDAVRAAIEQQLRILAQFAPPDEAQLSRQREALENLRVIGWEGDLDAMREGRSF
jgi:hypothetical protein